jgi:pimeloyl-ACP methyl ester carboxylesterase
VKTSLALAALAACSHPGDDKTYLLVHGAWLDKTGWDPVAAHLARDGAEVRTLDLPAHGSDPTPVSGASLRAYVDRVEAELDAAVGDTGRTILVGHSMAGVVVSQVAAERGADLAAVVYLAAYVPQTGQGLLDLAMMDGNSQIGPSLVFNNDGTVDVAQMAFPDLFCADCDGDARASLVASYRAEPVMPLGEKVTLDGDFANVRKTYIHTAQDRVVSPTLQGQMTAATPMDREVTLDASHAAMLSVPDDVAAALLDE